MKFSPVILSALLLSASAQAEVSGATQEFIMKKRLAAMKAQQLSAGKIENLRENKDKSNIIGTGRNINLGDLEPASGTKKPKKTKSSGRTNAPQGL